MLLSLFFVTNIRDCALVRMACACGFLLTVTSPWKIHPASTYALMMSPLKSVSPTTPSLALVVVNCWTCTQAMRPGFVTRSSSRMMNP